MDTKKHVLSYGIRSIKTMKASSSSSSTRKNPPLQDIENYLSSRVDHIISRCITFLLCMGPASTLDTLQLMLKYFTDIKFTGKCNIQSFNVSKPRHDQKLLLSTTIGPIISKLVNRMIFVRPNDPISYFIDEIKMMIHLESDISETTVYLHDNNAEGIESLSTKKIIRPESAPIAVANKTKPVRPVSAIESTTSTSDSSSVKPSRKIQIGLFGLGGVGKTTVLSCIQGELNRNAKPTIGFRPISMSLNSTTTICFYDLGGSSKIREIWHQYYHDIHGALYVIDSRSCHSLKEFSDTKSVFDSFNSSSFVKGKPILIIVNNFGDNSTFDKTAVVEMLNIDANSNQMKVIQCIAGGVKGPSTDSSLVDDLAIDSRIEEGVDWLISSISANYSALNEKVISDTATWHQEELQRQLARERKVLKSKIASSFFNDIESNLQSAYEPSSESDILSQSDGIEFLAAEIGEDVNALPLISMIIAKSVGYQRLALQIVGALKAPISKKKTPMTWESILALINSIREELGLPIDIIE